jgi:ribosomal protein L37AE/L43A
MPDTPTPENPGECESCHYETPALTYSADRILRSIWLCDLCAGTLAGNAAKNPVAYPHADVLRTICYVGNVILAEIRRQKP